MATRILLITPDEGFGELIHQVLVEDGGFEVVLASDGISALAAAQGGDVALTILDCEIADVPFPELVTALTDWHPNMRLIAIPPNNNPAHSSLENVTPHAFLTKPFYLPEMLKIVNKILDGGRVNVEMLAEKTVPGSSGGLQEMDRGDGEEPYPWLEDVNRAAQYLARLTMETAAKAALISRGERLWAYAGELGQPAGDELAEMVGRQWGSQRGNDLARFIKLENEQEYMLYATGLVDGLVLALIFDAKTPFSKIRSQSSRLAKALASAPEAGRRPPDLRPAFEREQASGGAPRAATAQPAAPDRAVHRPAPLVEIDAATWTESAEPELEAIESASLPVDWLPANLPDDWSLLEEVEEVMEPFSIPSDWQPVYPPPETMAETRPTRVPPEEETPQLEPESASFFSITYACVLLPRWPQHHLVRDLAKQLEAWMFQICVSFDWRLEQLAIRPGNLQWMVKVHSATAPRFLMQIITRLTSQRIFEHFPHYKDDNPSGEFWAPGWLVITSEKPPSSQMVGEFIRKTRRRQGVEE